MNEKLINIRKYLKKIILFAILFAAIFIALFYLVNMDIDSMKNGKGLIQTPDQNIKSDEQIKKLTGSTDFYSAGYEEWAKINDLTRSKDPNLDPDKDGLINYLEYIHGTNPLEADGDNDGFSDKQEIINGYDPDASGDAKPLVEISISKINVAAPMVWSKSDDEDSMLKDLENGLNHYPESASPGQSGNVVISGHSSNYIWAKGSYNHIFKDLNNLEKGDTVNVKTLQKNGKVIVYKYRVIDKFITIPDDERIFAETSGPTLTLQLAGHWEQITKD